MKMQVLKDSCALRVSNLSKLISIVVVVVVVVVVHCSKGIEEERQRHLSESH